VRKTANLLNNCPGKIVILFYNNITIIVTKNNITKIIVMKNNITKIVKLFYEIIER